ncbi:TPA: GGDEF domain-containing protein [Raoultella planticola]|uniref:sensor domain-containing diguanylate cyclase n=1 Tax=Raoultella planticola TaxID=575 RepID=UPI001A2AD2EC|nr:GGDEF domain-containing protein [Raoultella planticola]HAT1647406.1 GGDEF domain-containing protein [Raoultella planticola]
MLTANHNLLKRVFLYILACLIATGAIHLFAASLISRTSTFSPVLFPILTIFLLIFHATIACVMAMKYWCDRERLYLTAIACAFAGSALLMLGTLNSFPGWLTCGADQRANANDALIFYIFRNIMMMALFITSITLYYFRHKNRLTRGAHAIILSGCLGFTMIMVILSWLYSSNHPLLGITLVDNFTSLFTPLWQHFLGGMLIAGWSITLGLLIWISQLRNTFWYSGAFFCAAYIVTLIILLMSGESLDYSWYYARFFETISTLFMLIILLCDVFALYRESREKYLYSYQNSIRDSLTRLYNRSHFYDTLTALLPTVSVSRPLSVVVSDLDYFKRINDNYGHVQGDKVIQFTANVLQKNVRAQDTAARIGGEEFALLLVDTGSKDALTIAERIRQTISQTQEDLPEKMTISAGVFTTSDGSLSAEECVRRADAAMYAAKNGGRNRVVIWRE